MGYRTKIFGAAALFLAGLGLADSAMAQTAFVGQMGVFAYTFCPQNWMQTNGQTLKIPDYPALYSLLGKRYGGDGQTTFALPNVTPPPSQDGGALMGCIAAQGPYPQKPQ